MMGLDTNPLLMPHSLWSRLERRISTNRILRLRRTGHRYKV